jgi:hypothetical protein
MKYAALLLVVLLSACQKDDMSVLYAATCDRCFVEYQSDNRSLSSVTVEGYWNVFIADSIVTDTVIYIMDSTRVYGTWSTAVELEHDAVPVLKARNAGSSKYAEVVAEYDGKRKSASTTVGGETVSAH